MRDDDPVTGRQFLTRSAYADDRHLKSRQAIFAYAEAPAAQWRRTSHVSWDGTQVVLYHVPDIQAAVGELRRIVKPGGTVLASTNSAGSLAEILELLNAAVSAQLGRAFHPPSALSFRTETGAQFLGAEFSQVSLHRHDVPLSFPEPGPVVGYLASLGEPILAEAAEPFDFDAALAEVAVRVDHLIRVHGRFRATFRTGVFVCR